MSDNHYRKVSKISLVIVILLAIGVFVPANIGVDMMQYGFGIAFITGFLAICALITSLVYAKYAKQMEQIINKENILAHWTFTDEDWKKQAKEEYKTAKSSKIGMLFVIGAWAIFFGILFPILDPEDGIGVTYTMGGVIVLMAIVAWLSILYSKKVSKKEKGEVFISPNGILINGQMHVWSIFPSHLSSVKFKQNKGLSILEFSIFYGRIENFLVRIPVPKSKEKDAKEIVNKLIN